MPILLFFDFSKIFTYFSQIGTSDVVDFISVAMLFYLLYRLIRGSAAFKIFIGLLVVYLLWKLVVLFHLKLLSELFKQVFSVGIIAIIIVFQPEIRQFLLYLGSKNPLKKANFMLWKERTKHQNLPKINIIVKACSNMSASQTGALIVITRENNLEDYVQTGEIINARTSRELIETIFFKNTPLHDGALIINQQTMVAARCILPVSKRDNIPSHLGLRHRSAIGITEATDSIAIVVSEQTGSISCCMEGKIKSIASFRELKSFLENIYLS